MKLSAKIAFGFSSILVLTAIVGAIGWAGLSGYAAGVDKARSMSALVVDLHRLPLHIVEFERGEDHRGLAKAQQIANEALQRAGRLSVAEDATSLAAMTRELRAYRDALQRYADLHDENQERQSDIAEVTGKIDHGVRRIYDANYDSYLKGLLILEELEGQSERRFAFLEGANSLMRATLAARQAEAAFQLDPDAATRQQAAAYMKEIYLSNLSLRKIAKKAGEESEAIKALSSAVKEYRRRFGAFIQAVDEGSGIGDRKRTLDAASQKVQALAEGIADRQREAFASISGQARSAREKVGGAFAAATRSMTLTNTFLALRDTEEAFFRLRDPAISDRIGSMIEEATRALADLAEQTRDDSAIVQQTQALLPSYRSALDAASSASLGQADALAAMRDLEASVLRLADENAAQAVDDMASLYAWGRMTLAAFCMIALIAGATISLMTGRSIARPLKALTASIAELARGNAEAVIPELDRSDEIGDMARSMGVIRETGAIALRAQKTLEHTDACLMMVDNSGRIAHVNPAFSALVEQVREAVGDELPGFALSRFDDQPFDVFHNEPSLHQGKLRQLTTATRTLVSAGGHSFDLTLTPIFDERDAPIGTVVSWIDRTLQLRLEAEVEALIGAAAAGDLQGRLAIDHVDGFMLTLCQGMNRLMDTVETGVKAAGGVMSALASGDLNREMVGTYQGIFEELQDDSNRMRAQLSSIANSIIAASEALNVAAKEIGSGTADLTCRTQAQSSSVEATSMSMNELAQAVKLNTENAKEANEIAAKTRLAADSGHHVVTQAVEAMEGIQSAANKVTDIVSMIDGIAFQTNLLALNAAVEAARAGEAGKSFAVVASEVRALAQRSAEASGEIKSLIEETVSEIGGGVSLVQEVGLGLREIVGSVNALADLVSCISQAGQEQTAQLVGVGKAVSEMGGMADQNAALAEETMAAVRSQGRQVDELNRLLHFFKIDRDDRDDRLTHRPAPAALMGDRQERAPAA